MRPPIRVLIIDDDEGDYILAKDLLEEIDPKGFSISWKHHYEAGLEAICSDEYDICLLDNRLGPKSGIELLKECKERKCYVPIILLTGNSEREVDFSAWEHGAADFLEKSDLNASKLDRAVRYTLLQYRHSSHLEKLVNLRSQELQKTNEVLQEQIKARDRSEALLRFSEERFRHLADSIPQIVWISEPDGTIEYINSQWVAYTGLTLAQSRTPELNSAVIHPDDLPQLYETWKVAQEQKTIHQFELRIRRYSDKQFRWFLSRTVPVFNAQGELIKWYGTSTDIHQQKLQEEEQRDANRRKDIFLASMAHELRNPLPPIRNALEIMRLSGNKPETVERCRGMIDRQLNHLVRLVDDLLDLSRFTRGKLNVRHESVDLRNIVESAIETSRPLIELAQHKLTLNLPKKEIFFDGDPTRLTQVLVNLLNNSAKYTPPQGEISLSASKENDYIHFHVKDNGIGIPPDKLSTVFEMFNQLDRNDASAQGGLGIGLALVKGIIQLHNGTVEAKSEGTNKGSQFSVKLPCSRCK